MQIVHKSHTHRESESPRPSPRQIHICRQVGSVQFSSQGNQAKAGSDNVTIAAAWLPGFEQNSIHFFSSSFFSKAKGKLDKRNLVLELENILLLHFVETQKNSKPQRVWHNFWQANKLSFTETWLEGERTSKSIQNSRFKKARNKQNENSKVEIKNSSFCRGHKWQKNLEVFSCLILVSFLKNCGFLEWKIEKCHNSRQVKGREGKGKQTKTASDFWENLNEEKEFILLNSGNSRVSGAEKGTILGC